jgi:hypothetical protein
VNKKTFDLSTKNLIKGSRQMKVVGDEGCQSKLDNGVSSFDFKSEICTMHEATDADNDSQPVTIYIFLLNFNLAGVMFSVKSRSTMPRL